MCRECGEFVAAVSEQDDLTPVVDECPSCGNGEFLDIHESEE